MSFQPIKGTEQNKFTALPMAASTTIVAGTALAFTNGYLRPATSSDAEVRYVALEGKVTTSGQNPLISVVETQGVTFIADAAANSARAAVGTKVDLSDATKINVSATTNGTFFVADTFGPAANKQYTGYFTIS